MEKRLASTAREYVLECVKRETPPRVEEFSRNLGYSPQYVREMWRHTFGHGPAVYLKRLQLDIALNLLHEHPLTLAQVAYRSGFGTRRTMFRVFQNQLGLTPGECRALGVFG